MESYKELCIRFNKERMALYRKKAFEDPRLVKRVWTMAKQIDTFNLSDRLQRCTAPSPTLPHDSINCSD
jgi:hypothetical protein